MGFKDYIVRTRPGLAPPHRSMSTPVNVHIGQCDIGHCENAHPYSQEGIYQMDPRTNRIQSMLPHNYLRIIIGGDEGMPNQIELLFPWTV